MSSTPIPFRGIDFPLNVTNRAFWPNQFNSCLDREVQKWNWINMNGGIHKFCRGNVYRQPPWIVAPAQAERFTSPSSIPLPAADGADHVVLSFKVPHGFDGVAEVLVNNYTGNGFDEGSGDLTWRVLLNNRYPKGLGNIQFSLGSLRAPSPVNAGPLLMQSDQVVQYVVNNATTSTLAGGRIVCAVIGYWYPRGVYVP
jgi:hypothetical protein